MCMSWINRGQGFGTIANHRKRTAAGFDLIAKRAQIILAHKRHVDSERKQVTCLNLREGCRQTAKRAARRRIVRYKLHIERSPGRICPGGNENFRGFQFAQEVELNLPERFSAKNDRRLV